MPVKIALIVPAYKPTEDMLPMLERFSKDERYVPVVVNDGSGSDFDGIFSKVPEGVHLIVHPENRGKGAALKTAMQYILDELPECALAVTADADGQHFDEDIRKVAAISEADTGALVLGSRAFDGDVPLRSRFGNSVTRQVFSIASGVKLQDTQTGLRAFGRELIPEMLDIPGERYEYEINMLLYMAQKGVPIRETTIHTVYINDNEASHFNPIRDSLKIYMCIFKFIASSLIGFIVDYLLVILLTALTKGMGPVRSLYFSTIVARIVSASVNFTINKKVVFKSGGGWKSELAKYAVLAVFIWFVNVQLLKILTIHLRMPIVIAKLLVEVALFAVSFVVQGKFVYRRNANKK
ncbi:MAG: glycosyltransferase [Clostridiales bacterium]|nr:glycosyltransferase [Clostridiales bacterium]